MRSRFDHFLGHRRYARQGFAPQNFHGRARVDYIPTNYVRTLVQDQTERLEELTSHLAGIDAALAGGPAVPDNWVPHAPGDNLVPHVPGDNLVVHL